LFPLFATGGVVDTGDATWLEISPQMFEKILNDPYFIFRGLGKMIYEKT
jgi:hypothetical protein